MDQTAARQWAELRLSPHRLAHVAGVAAMADELAWRVGEDTASCRLAAWLHDSLKEDDGPALAAEASRRGLADELRLPFLLHASVMGARALADLGVSAAVAEAITYHPIGRPGLGQIGQILYLADKLEPGRQYDGVEALRKLAREDLASGLRATVQAIRDFQSRRLDPQPIHPLTEQWLSELKRGGQRSHKTS
jgi:predicted HD superfamily hydrolase involved in NAD metabolism